MKQLGTIIRNTGYLALAETVKPFLSFILILIIARMLGREGIGSYSIILTFTGLFELIATVGLGPLIVRGIAADRSQLSFYISGAMGVALLSSAILLPLMLLILRAMNYPAEIALTIRLLAYTLLLAILQQYVISICEGLQNMRLRAILTVADTAGRLIAGVFMVLQGHGVLGIIEGIVLVRAITTAIAFVVVARHTGLLLDYRLTLRSCAGFARAALPFLLMTIASTVFWSINTMMLSKLSSVEDVGIYNAANRITAFLRNFLYSYQRSAADDVCILCTVPGAISTGVQQIHQIFGVPDNTDGNWSFGVGSASHSFNLRPQFRSGDPCFTNSRVDNLRFLHCVGLRSRPDRKPQSDVGSILQCRRVVHQRRARVDTYSFPRALRRGDRDTVFPRSLRRFEYCSVTAMLFKPEVIVPLAQGASASIPMGLVVFYFNALPLIVVILIGTLVYLAALICTGAFSSDEIGPPGI